MLREAKLVFFSCSKAADYEQATTDDVLKKETNILHPTPINDHVSSLNTRNNPPEEKPYPALDLTEFARAVEGKNSSFPFDSASVQGLGSSGFPQTFFFQL